MLCYVRLRIACVPLLGLLCWVRLWGFTWSLHLWTWWWVMSKSLAYVVMLWTLIHALLLLQHVGVILVMYSKMLLYMLTLLYMIIFVLCCVWFCLKEYVVIGLYRFLIVHKSFKSNLSWFLTNFPLSIIFKCFMCMFPYLVHTCTNPYFYVSTIM